MTAIPSAREAARKAARDLFIGGFKDHAVRLVMELPGSKLDGAGWCEEAVADRLEAAFEQYARSRLGPLITFDKVGADHLADEVAVLIDRRVIDSRSPAGDALLDYREPPQSPRSDALVDLRVKLSALLAAIDPLLAAEEKATPGPWQSGVVGHGGVVYYDQDDVHLICAMPANADLAFITTAKNACAGLRAALAAVAPEEIPHEP